MRINLANVSAIGPSFCGITHQYLSPPSYHTTLPYGPRSSDRFPTLYFSPTLSYFVIDIISLLDLYIHTFTLFIAHWNLMLANITFIQRCFSLAIPSLHVVALYSICLHIVCTIHCMWLQLSCLA